MCLVSHVYPVATSFSSDQLAQVFRKGLLAYTGRLLRRICRVLDGLSDAESGSKPYQPLVPAGREHDALKAAWTATKTGGCTGDQVVARI